MDLNDALPAGRILVDRAHCGPPDSGNGGWVCGLLAQRCYGRQREAVTVRLHSPPPLDRPLTIAGGPEQFTLSDGDHHVASSRRATPDDAGDPLPAPAALAQATAATSTYAGSRGHPFPTCFTCGTARQPEDALRLQPGPLGDGTTRYAAVWTPRAADATTATAEVWAALDCPGGWACGLESRPMVLGEMTAAIADLPVPGIKHVVTAWTVGGAGRKHRSATVLSTSAGDILAWSRATWITVDPATVRPVEESG